MITLSLVEGNAVMAAIAILDDYQNVALRMADWSRLQQANRIVVFNERLPRPGGCGARAGRAST